MKIDNLLVELTRLGVRYNVMSGMVYIDVGNLSSKKALMVINLCKNASVV